MQGLLKDRWKDHQKNNHPFNTHEIEIFYKPTKIEK